MKFIETPFNYTGSKFKMLDQLVPIFDYNKSNFIDLFAGGGSVYTNVIDKYDSIQANDIIFDLMEIQRKLILDDTTKEVVKNLAVAKDDAVGYGLLRTSYNQEKTPEKLYALMLCCTNNMMRFNKKFEFNQTFGKRSYNPKTEEKINKFSNHLRPHLDKIKFTSYHFSAVVPTRDSMVYIDPPYSNTEAGYNSYWNKDDDRKLFEYCVDLNRNGHSFCVSGIKSHNGETCLVLDLLIGAGFKQADINYNYNKVSRQGKKDTQEIIIKNY